MSDAFWLQGYMIFEDSKYQYYEDLQFLEIKDKEYIDNNTNIKKKIEDKFIKSNKRYKQYKYNIIDDISENVNNDNTNKNIEKNDDYENDSDDSDDDYEDDKNYLMEVRKRYFYELNLDNNLTKIDLYYLYDELDLEIEKENYYEQMRNRDSCCSCDIDYEKNYEDINEKELYRYAFLYNYHNDFYIYKNKILYKLDHSTFLHINYEKLFEAYNKNIHKTINNFNYDLKENKIFIGLDEFATLFNLNNINKKSVNYDLIIITKYLKSFDFGDQFIEYYRKYLEKNNLKLSNFINPSIIDLDIRNKELLNIIIDNVIKKNDYWKQIYEYFTGDEKIGHLNGIYYDNARKSRLSFYFKYNKNNINNVLKLIYEIY